MQGRQKPCRFSCLFALQYAAASLVKQLWQSLLAIACSRGSRYDRRQKGYDGRIRVYLKHELDESSRKETEKSSRRDAEKNWWEQKAARRAEREEDLFEPDFGPIKGDEMPQSRLQHLYCLSLSAVALKSFEVCSRCTCRCFERDCKAVSRVLLSLHCPRYDVSIASPSDADKQIWQSEKEH